MKSHPQKRLTTLVFNSDKTMVLTTDKEIITYTLASFGQRLIARLIDLVIVTLLVISVMMITENILVLYLVVWLYWSLQHSSRSQSTIGQKIIKIRLYSFVGHKITFEQASGRFIADSFLNISSLLIGYFMMFFNKKTNAYMIIV